MLTNYRIVGCGAAALVFLAAGSSFAGINSFTSRPTFNAAAGVIDANENFSGFGVDTQFRSQTVAANGFTLAQEGFDGAFRNFVDVSPFQFTDNNGTTHASTFTNFAEGATAATDVRVAFPVKARAFGADFYDIEGGAVAEGLVADVIVNNAVAATFALPNNPGTFGFFGVVATAGEQIDSVLLRSASLLAGTTGEGFGLDDAAVSFIPEPASLAVVAGLGLFATGRRRR